MVHLLCKSLSCASVGASPEGEEAVDWDLGMGSAAGAHQNMPCLPPCPVPVQNPSIACCFQVQFVASHIVSVQGRYEIKEIKA